MFGNFSKMKEPIYLFWSVFKGTILFHSFLQIFVFKLDILFCFCCACAVALCLDKVIQ